MQTPHGQQLQAVARMQTHTHTSMYRMYGHRLCGVRPRLGLGSHMARGWREIRAYGVLASRGAQLIRLHDSSRQTACNTHGVGSIMGLPVAS